MACQAHPEGRTESTADRRGRAQPPALRNLRGQGPYAGARLSLGRKRPAGPACTQAHAHARTRTHTRARACRHMTQVRARKRDVSLYGQIRRPRRVLGVWATQRRVNSNGILV